MFFPFLTSRKHPQQMRRSHNFDRRLKGVERLEERVALAADFNGSGTVDGDDLDIWETGYGSTMATQMDGDADGDTDVDGFDFLAWQREFEPPPLVAPRGVEARAVGAAGIEVTWEASVGATDYLVARRQPGGNFTAIANNVVGTSYTDSAGLMSGTLYEYVVVAQQGEQPPSTLSQVAQATVDRANLTAYRPQGVYDPDDNSTPEPMYDPFPKRPVPEQIEADNERGPGIRINHDDDDNSGVPDVAQTGAPVTRENDLIEVKVDRLPDQGDLVLIKGSQLALFLDHDKDTLLPLENSGNTTEPLPFGEDDSVTVWVEWTSITHGTANLSLVDPATSTTLDTVRFHSFRSIIIAFGGNGQNPADTDGDGFIGDFEDGGPNREGLFDIAQIMYNTGWDVLAFDEEDVDAADDIPYREVISARQERFVEQHGIIGYSQGGGATHDLIVRVHENEDIITDIGVYLDAVRHDFISPETRWPEVVVYLLSIYETITEIPIALGGEAIEDVLPGAILEEIDTTGTSGWDSDLDHFSIDDDFQVRNHILTRLHQRLFNR